MPIEPPSPAVMKPRPRPKPGGPPTAPPSDLAEITAAAHFGRVDDEGTVYVRDGEGERPVGQYPGATAGEALAYYCRKYQEISAQIGLLEQRLAGAGISGADATTSLKQLQDAVVEPKAVGDLETLRARVSALQPLVSAKAAEADAQRAATRERAIAAREALVLEAEKLAETDPARMQWKAASERLRTLFEEWKAQQRGDNRLDRRHEEPLWHRFSRARSVFERARRQHFAALDEERAGAKELKAAIVAEAEKLSTSTEWGATAGAYRALMDRWKAAGRAGRTDDDALWNRFRAAQDAFFGARNAASQQDEAEFVANLAVKETLATEAEALLPITDLAAARTTLRSIQERWEDAGKVPRADLQRIEARLRVVEEAVRDADQNRWQRSNPEGHARALAMVEQLETAISQLEATRAAAQARGDDKAAARVTSDIEGRQQWLEQARHALAEFAG